MSRRSTTTTAAPTIRCAIYVRKSTDENLDTDFNSLDAQRAAAEAYIASQQGEGWVALPERYDDAAYSGGTLERPALQRLLADIEAGKIDCVVTYKVDRLSRSLLDFTKLVEVFDRHGVTFISVTQSFCTTTSMGRLTLNMLLSFAQFEREVIGERIRDKVAASKQRGMYMGGTPPLGYDVVNKKLIVNPAEADLVREIFRRFVTEGSTTRLAQALNAEGKTTKAWTTKDGKVRAGTPWHKGHIYQLLNNRLYLGQVEHKGNVYPGEHQAIVSQEEWDQVHDILSENYRVRANRQRAKVPGLLKGVIRCGHCKRAMGITYTKKKGSTTHYRYYLCTHAAKAGHEACPVRTVPAGEIEASVVALLRRSLMTPEVAARTYREARGLVPDAADEQDIILHLRQFNDLWDELFPAEQARIVKLLIDQVTVYSDQVDIALRADGLYALLDEWRGAKLEMTSDTAC
jgi:DNA invertase Pin-like site-specific DNA recombinase